MEKKRKTRDQSRRRPTKRGMPKACETVPGRPRAFETGAIPWNLHEVPETIQVKDKEIPHPSRQCGIFVVHGMGMQCWTETAALLRSGFEDAVEKIKCWQQKSRKKPPISILIEGVMPPPFIYEGFWADYEEIASSFPETWSRFNDREKRLFGNIWKYRVLSGLRTFLWFWKQQLRLLSPKVFMEVGVMSWLLYFPLQIISPVTLFFALLRRPKLITRFLGDVRLYFDPRGMIEEAIVQRIDYRVGEAFLQMIGLDWEFRSLHKKQCIEASGEYLCFDRIIWVAHSLGTVISYNVLSDLFHRSRELRKQGDAEQKLGAKRFETALRRFVTMGSPLDKAAFLFPRALRPWPEGSRFDLLPGGEGKLGRKERIEPEWWINFYHVLDPVSGALSNPLLFENEPPFNFHIGFFRLPGFAHVAYWRDSKTLRFILGRTFGKDFLRDREYRPISLTGQYLIGLAGYIVWASLIFGIPWLVIRYWPQVIRSLLKVLGIG